MSSLTFEVTFAVHRSRVQSLGLKVPYSEFPNPQSQIRNSVFCLLSSVFFLLTRVFSILPSVFSIDKSARPRITKGLFPLSMSLKKISVITATNLVVANMIGTGVFTRLGFQLHAIH